MMPRASSQASAGRTRLMVLRRLVAALAFGALVIGCLEPLAAEAHDGDSAVASAVAAVPLGGTGAPSEPAAPAHAMHLCHCTHAHGASKLPSTEVHVVVSLVDESAPQRPLLAPSNVTRDGLMRPPATTHG